jgi:hypothetical protein
MIFSHVIAACRQSDRLDQADAIVNKVIEHLPKQ